MTDEEIKKLARAAAKAVTLRALKNRVNTAHGMIEMTVSEGNVKGHVKGNMIALMVMAGELVKEIARCVPGFDVDDAMKALHEYLELSDGQWTAREES